jgi:hypothetical protein
VTPNAHGGSSTCDEAEAEAEHARGLANGHGKRERNVAESSGENVGADRTRFLMIARASSLECGAILDVGVALGAVDPTAAASGRALLARIVAMLTKRTR